VQGGLFIFTCVRRPRDRVAVANERLSASYNQDFSKMVASTLAGSPQDCVNRLREYIDARRGPSCSLGCPPDYVEKNTRLIAEAVVPAFR
jgi:alkanesulfonate monooxygenase SsuD/methylene tetrahydromethanopterin reductase-like flavin-dependent oxidoreductase (luciferase family)